MKTAKSASLRGVLAVAMIVAPMATLVGCGITDEGLNNLTDLLSQLASEFSARNAQGQMMDRPGGLVARLHLTAEQKELARQVFDAQHADIKALHDQARADIRNLLTADQQTIFDELPPPHPPHHGPGHGPGQGPPPMGGMMGAQNKPMGPPPGMQGEPPDPEQMRQERLDRLAETLGLTEDQIAQVGMIFDNLDAAIKARHEQAKLEFRAILTPEQIAILDDLEAQHSPPQP